MCSGFIEEIYKDYGAERLRIALKAYMDFIVYYEQGHNNTIRKIEREIHEKHCNVLNAIDPSRVLENEINEYWEGKIGQVTITTHERSAEARNKCIRIKGIKCAVCGFDFESTYGELGKGFIHIHHVNPISNMKLMLSTIYSLSVLIVTQCYIEKRGQHYQLKNLNK